MGCLLQAIAHIAIHWEDSSLICVRRGNCHNLAFFSSGISHICFLSNCMIIYVYKLNNSLNFKYISLFYSIYVLSIYSIYVLPFSVHQFTNDVYKSQRYLTINLLVKTFNWGKRRHGGRCELKQHRWMIRGISLLLASFYVFPNLSGRDKWFRTYI